jgi:ribonuclease Z
MIKFVTYLFFALIVLAGLLRLSIESEDAQDTAINQLGKMQAIGLARGLPNPDALRVFICGSGSPLGVGRAQACVAILTPNHFYIIDSGAGSTANVSRANLPLQRLQGVLLTHFHSDHISEIYELNLSSWVAGRPEALKVIGPKGVKKVVAGINDTYELDRQYRVDHHGKELLNPQLALLDADTIKPGVILEDGDLTITAYVADHTPVNPALGYRVDYRGRSVVISGDSNVTPATKRISANVDLLIHDALSRPILTRIAAAAEAAGLNRRAKIVNDVVDYHASTDSLIALGEEIQIGMVTFYHLVPIPANIVMQKMFERNLPDNFMIANDSDWFELPSGTKEIKVMRQ